MAKIKCHIESFPTKETMYDLFIKKYSEEKETVKYEFYEYLKVFTENFVLKFGRPQVDACGECEKLSMKLKDHRLNDTAKRVAAAEMMVHKRRANKFYTRLKGIKSLC
nr:unnamed protein product [Callosobruchus analis]